MDRDLSNAGPTVNARRNLDGQHAGNDSVALIEAPYNVMLKPKKFRTLFFVGDLMPSPLAGFGT
jgi:hypothetical protein